MKSGRLMTFLLAILLNGAWAENQAYEAWIKRKESLIKDPSVARYYTFEGLIDSKSPVKDLTGRGNDLAFIPVRAGKKDIDDLTIIEGRFPGKTAVRLDRGYYQGPAVEIEKRSFTAECWFRRSGRATIYDEIKSSVGTLLLSGAGGKGWILNYSSARVSCVPGTASGDKKNIYFQARARSANVPEGVWQHAALTWDGKEVIFYLNGSIAGRIKHDGEYNKADYPFRVGLHASEKIDIDEVVIHNRVLSSAEMKKAGGGNEGLAADRINSIFSSADGMIKKKDFEGARREYGVIKDISGIDYASALYLFNTAESYRLEKKSDLAKKYYAGISRDRALSVNYRAYALFCMADILAEEGNNNVERNAYQEILKLEGLSGNDSMRARRGIGDTYLRSKEYMKARDIYENLLREVSSSPNPNEVHRLELIDRLESIDGLPDGKPIITPRQARIKRIKSPRHVIYVSVSGKDTNDGTAKNPFATIQRARDEIRRMKTEKGLPPGGVAVNIRQGEYLVEDTVVFTREDSGTEESPVVYMSHPGETARIIGGKKVSGFRPVEDKEVLDKLPAESRGKVLVADLRGQGINEYGELKNRGTGADQPGAMELIYDGKAMQMARWPNEGFTRVASLVNPRGDYTFRDEPYQKGKFKYSGIRPERWTGENDAWIRGYLGPKVPYVINHLRITGIDTREKIIYLAEDPRWENTKDPAYVGNRISRGTGFFAYNLLSEIDEPGEYYIDRKNGKLYFWPPGEISDNAIVTILDKPVMETNDASHMVFYRLVFEGTWRDGVIISGGDNNLLAGCTVRNTGQDGIYIQSGWGHSVAGCDIYDLGEGALVLADNSDYSYGHARAVENRRKLIPNGFRIENNHIYRVNRLDGSSTAISIRGIGQRISHNIITDSNHSAISITCNNHVIEYNEIHDVVAHSKELGAVYTWDLGQPMTFRGNILKNNFIHHITGHYSPNDTHGVRAVHIDGLSSNLTLSGNVFFRTSGISSSAPDCRFENNIFVDCFPGISQGNRSSIMESDGKLNSRGYRLIEVLEKFEYRLPPWSERYPQLAKILNEDKRPLGWPRNITISRNVSMGGPFAIYASGVRSGNDISNNIDETDPLFYNIKKMDFRLRSGSPVYGQAGFEPIPFENIGLYNDELRATWPVKREIGKYFDPSKEASGSSKPKEYSALKRKNLIKIDGRLEKDEWLGLDKDKAIQIDRYYQSSQDMESPLSHAWLLYDDKYLYIGVDHAPDPWSPDMPLAVKEIPLTWGMTEISVEGVSSDEIKGWWLPDMETGPIYLFMGYPDGNLRILDSYFKMPENTRLALEKNVEYAAVMHDPDTYNWSAELKIPLSAINLNLDEVKTFRFNIGVRRRKNWAAWMYTGGKVWRLEGGGRIKIEK